MLKGLLLFCKLKQLIFICGAVFVLEQTFAATEEQTVTHKEKYGFKSNTALEGSVRSSLILLSLKCIIHTVAVHKPGINIFERSSDILFSLPS